MIRIVTDSAADLTAAELSLPGIFVVPLSVTFADGTTQLDDGTMTKDEFFVRLAEDSKLPRTSQPSPQSFMTIFEDAKENGDQVIAILISSNLSGTYQCARLAAEMVRALDQMYLDWQRDPRAYLDDYRARCVTVGRPVRVVRGEDVRTGFAEAVDDDFALVVRWPDGTRETVTGGDVSVRGLFGYLD